MVTDFLFRHVFEQVFNKLFKRQCSFKHVHSQSSIWRLFILCYINGSIVGWVAGRACIRPKTECWGAGMVICLERGADLHMAQLMPLLLTVSCFSKIQIGFTYLVPAHLGSPGKRAVKRACVCDWCFVPRRYLWRMSSTKSGKPMSSMRFISSSTTQLWY